MEIGKKIKELRTQKGISQTELAKAIGARGKGAPASDRRGENAALQGGECAGLHGHLRV